MRPTTFLSAFLSALSLAQASPTAGPDASSWGSQPICLSQAVAADVVAQFSSLLTKFSAATATSLLSPTNFSDFSDSINFLGGFPLGGVTFPNAQAFIAGQGAQPPIGFQVLNIDAVTCDGTIVFRWVATVGPQQLKVKGINVLNVALEGKDPKKAGDGGWRLTRVFSEFNSGVWTNAIGGTCKPPKQL